MKLLWEFVDEVVLKSVIKNEIKKLRWITILHTMLWCGWNEVVRVCWWRIVVRVYWSLSLNCCDEDVIKNCCDEDVIKNCCDEFVNEVDNCS